MHIDVTVIAAPTADAFGNADGSHGKSVCGSLGFALADSMYADRVIVVTDNLVPFPCIPGQIQGNNVDYVVEVDSIGDPEKIVSGIRPMQCGVDEIFRLSSGKIESRAPQAIASRRLWERDFLRQCSLISAQPAVLLPLRSAPK